MSLELKQSGSQSCDWVYQNTVNIPDGAWPPTPLPYLTQTQWQQLTNGRLKSLMTRKYEAIGEQSAASVFAEAAARAGLSGLVNQGITATNVSFRLDDNGYPFACWLGRRDGGLTPMSIHISIIYSASA